MVKLSVHNLEGKESGSLDLPKDIFEMPVNTGVIHQAVTMYRASLRQGTASTKIRKEVSGGGKKPWRQKGTGRARVGSSRSPLWVGGGTIFGPRPRDFGYSVPQKIRKAALKESLNAKYQSKTLICLEDIKAPMSKTKEFAKVLNNLKLKGKILGVLDGSDPSVQQSSRNIFAFSQVRAQDVNAYDIMKNKNILVTKTGMKALLARVVK